MVKCRNSELHEHSKNDRIKRISKTMRPPKLIIKHSDKMTEVITSSYLSATYRSIRL